MATSAAPDLGDDFYRDWIAMAGRLGVDPIDLIRPAFAETAVRLRGGISGGGVIGFIPSTLPNIGWKGTPEEFFALSALEQIPWVERYYRPYAPWMKSDALVYVASFTPAFLHAAAASGPSFVLASRDGANKHIYEANPILDRNHDGLITVGDLSQHLNIMDHGARYDAIIQGLQRNGASLRVATALGSSSKLLPLLMLAAAGGYLWYSKYGTRLPWSRGFQF